MPAAAPVGDAAGTVDGAVTRAAQAAFGRIVASLAWRWRDLAAAQDALADALVAALESWPRDGVPACPEAWLTTAARRRLLQAVLGLDAARVASAFLVSPAAMAQRLVRAKQRIRDARIPFELPGPDELAPRLGAVLEAVYAAFTADWDAADPLDDAAGTLAEEAIFLARLVVGCMPQEPEAIGLLALLLSCHARRGARFDPSGAFVPLEAQDSGRWDGAAIVEADRLLCRAAALRRPGPFQIEAAIQSAHCQRHYTGQVPWRGIAQLYAALDRHRAHVGPEGARLAGRAGGGGRTCLNTARPAGARPRCAPGTPVSDRRPHASSRAAVPRPVRPPRPSGP